MIVCKSKLTPGIKANETNFFKGEVVQFQLADGPIIDITIDSERMSHKKCETFGYEAIFSDDGKRAFADVERIVSWFGKV